MVQMKYSIKSNINLKYIILICIVAYLTLLNLSCHTNGSTCVSGDTPVLTPNGNIPAGKLNIGDEIYSYDFSRRAFVTAKISNIRSGFDNCIIFNINNGKTLKVTPDHPIYSPETGTYEKASKWRSAELSQIYTFEKSMPTIANVTSLNISREMISVFDITVDSHFGNFLANGILVHNKTPPLDATPPVDDLEIVETDSNSVTLAWTVPGNDQVYPVGYDIRFLDREWQPGEFWIMADTITGEPVPSAPATRDTMTVENLLNSTTYWFGMRTISNDDGYSNLSNIVSGTTQ